MRKYLVGLVVVFFSSIITHKVYAQEIIHPGISVQQCAPTIRSQGYDPSQISVAPKATTIPKSGYFPVASSNEGPFPNVGNTPYPNAVVTTTPQESVVSGGAPTSGGPYGSSSRWMPPCQGIYPLFYGVIKSVSRWHIHFTDGRAADLHDYTVIAPAGGILHKGMRIAVRGYFEPDHSIGKPTLDAREITITNGDGLDH